MEKKINVAELLKDCPKGMELDCTMFEDVYFDCVDELNIIHCYIQHETHKTSLTFNQHGTPNSDIKSKCVIFPKGKTTWDGFQRPFKDGDIIFTHANCLKVGLGNTWISIYQEMRNGGVATYVDCAEDGGDYYSNIDEDKPLLCMEKDIMRQRFATEEEKQKLFDAIKENGYKWNAETKTLEKLIEPKFKVWDRIRHKYDYFRDERTIVSCGKSGYWTSINAWIDYENQDDWELVKSNQNKFDINTLVPFESRVLVRDSVKEPWKPYFFGCLSGNNNYPYIVIGGIMWKCCIPYKNNEHLLWTPNDCDDFYKTWE